MDKITKEYPNGNITLDAERFGIDQAVLDAEINNSEPIKAVVKRLAEYEDAEEKGLLMRLPDIPQNTEMYAVVKSNSGKYYIRKLKLTMWEIRRGVLLGRLYDGNWLLPYYPSDDGTKRQYIYRTKTEAEQALILKTRCNRKNKVNKQ